MALIEAGFQVRVGLAGIRVAGALRAVFREVREGRGGGRAHRRHSENPNHEGRESGASDEALPGLALLGRISLMRWDRVVGSRHLVVRGYL